VIATGFDDANRIEIPSYIFKTPIDNSISKTTPPADIRAVTEVKPEPVLKQEPLTPPFSEPVVQPKQTSVEEDEDNDFFDIMKIFNQKN
ncbi:MAG: hypothetical protein RR724_08795, partial [Hydrogenoanaerobacterium sp.]